MSRLHSSGRSSDPKVPYQQDTPGARVIKAPSPEAKRFSEDFNKRFRLTLKALAGK